MLEIYDATTNEYIGALLLDLYPRPNKCGHAFYDTIIPAQRGKASLAVILANIPKAMGDTPALFKHNDVVTFFHEFGHAMHGALGRTRLASCSGTSVARDFVEVPSQAFEEWMFNKATLKKLSCHYKTGQPLPDNVIENIEKSITFDSGLFLLRQCILSQISLNYALPGSQKDTDIIWQNAYQTLMPEIVLDPLVHPQASFGHLIWYQSKYYSYMWSKVMALDVFAQLEKENLSGKRFVACVLSKGGSQGPNILIKDYLGREPSMDAFLQILGIR
jgi:thimet oligopeptidase